MVSLEAAAALALALPDVVEGRRYGHRCWLVGTRTFAWERPFSKADLKRFGDRPPPAGDILAVSVADLGEKDAVIAANPDALFTIEHFANYPAVLVRLGVITGDELRELLLDGYRTVT